MAEIDQIEHNVAFGCPYWPVVRPQLPSLLSVPFEEKSSTDAIEATNQTDLSYRCTKRRPAVS